MEVVSRWQTLTVSRTVHHLITAPDFPLNERVLFPLPRLCPGSPLSRYLCVSQMCHVSQLCPANYFHRVGCVRGRVPLSRFPGECGWRHHEMRPVTSVGTQRDGQWRAGPQGQCQCDTGDQTHTPLPTELSPGAYYFVSLSSSLRLSSPGLIWDRVTGPGKPVPKQYQPTNQKISFKFLSGIWLLWLRSLSLVAEFYLVILVWTHFSPGLKIKWKSFNIPKLQTMIVLNCLFQGYQLFQDLRYKDGRI